MNSPSHEKMNGNWLKVKIKEDQITVPPESQATLQVGILNVGAQEDYVDILVKGVPAEWVVVHTPVLHLAAGEAKLATVTIQPPPVHDNRAIQYPLNVHVISQSDPKVSAVARSAVTVATYQSRGRIGVTLGSIQFAVTPGTSVDIPILMQNRGEEEDAFRDKQLSMKRATTCTCNACRNIPSLDLKFFIHCGDYIQQTIINTKELVGSDVNLVHRLTKNQVTEATGWRAYMLVTEQCLNCIHLDLANAYVQMEQYEHLGQIKTYNVNLHQRYKEITEARRIILDEKDADLTFQIDFPTPPAVTWEWIHDPDKRNLWNGGHVTWSAGDRPKGRPGIGSSNHCAHGESISTEVMVDWHPFEYYTAHSFVKGKHAFTETIRFEALPDGGTRVHDALRMHMAIPRFIRSVALKYVMITQHHYDKAMALAAELANEEFSRNNGE